MAPINIRELIKGVYKYSKTWSAKVDAMSDSQVLAVYKRFQSKGALK